MKLIYEGYPGINIQPGQISVLATNNPRIYFDFIQGLREINDKLKLVDDDLNSLTLSKHIDFDGDIVVAPQLTVSYQSLLVKQAAKNITEDSRKQIENQAQQLFTAVQEYFLRFDLPLEVQFDGDLKRLFKYCKIHYHQEILNNPYAIIENDLKLHLECGSDSIIVLNSVANYLTPDQFEELVQVNKELGTKVFLIEFTDFAMQKKFKNCDVHYIDEDFVDWHE